MNVKLMLIMILILAFCLVIYFKDRPVRPKYIIKKYMVDERVYVDSPDCYRLCIDDEQSYDLKRIKKEGE